MRVVASERQVATAAPYIPSEEWTRRVQAVQVRKEDVNSLVLNYLLTEGFAHAAAHFQEESGTAGTFDTETTGEAPQAQRCPCSDSTHAACALFWADVASQLAWT